MERLDCNCARERGGRSGVQDKEPAGELLLDFEVTSYLPEVKVETTVIDFFTTTR